MSTRALVPILFLCLLGVTLTLAGCGGASAPPREVPTFGTFPLPDGPGQIPDYPPPDDGGGMPPSSPTLTGGVLFTINSSGQVFQWWVTNPQTAQDLIDVFQGTKTVISFGGRLMGGQGVANHNAPWSWHVDPVVNGVDVLTVPESPKTPAQCELMLGYWLSLGVTFIPLSATIVAFDDRR